MKIRLDATEKEIEDVILQWLNLQYLCFAFKQDIKASYDPKLGYYRQLSKWVPKGGSDILASIHGKFCAFEVKKPSEYKSWFTSTGDREINQRSFIDKVKATGGIAACVCSLEQVIEFHSQLTRQRESAQISE